MLSLIDHILPEHRTTAETAIASFAEKYGAKYEKAVICLVKDRDALLTFHDFPAEPLAGLLTCVAPQFGSRPCWPFMGSPAHVQPDRKRVRHRPAPYCPDQGRAVAGHGPADGLQARHRRREDLAQAEG